MFLKSKSTITDVEFNPDISNGLFKLEFPQGAKVWDSVLKGWFIVGSESKGGQ